MNWQKILSNRGIYAKEILEAAVTKCDFLPFNPYLAGDKNVLLDVKGILKGEVDW